MRGPQKTPTYKHVSVRVPLDVYGYFKGCKSPSKTMREALVYWVEHAKKLADNPEEHN